MASKDKPYRVYRGGRARGPIRHPEQKERPRFRRGGDDAYSLPQAEPRRKRRIGRILLVLALLVLVLLIVWTTLGYVAFRRGVQEANERLPDRVERALAPMDGSLLSNPGNLLVLGTDAGPGKGRTGPARSDSIMIVRTDPDEHRIALLSIPRDLRVTIPGRGTDKINAAYAFGGPTLALRTVRELTGLEINHIAIVDFRRFGDVIDALGGITVDVPKRILSNKFDCPLKTPAECQRWEGWRFRKGPQEMNRRRALVYARIRENQFDPGESDVTRGARQQQVIQAIADEVVGFNGFLRMPFFGDEIVRPLATDLSANELIQLGWVKFRAPESNTLRCRLGGTPSDIGGVSYILGDEENAEVIAMVTGRSAPQPPLPGSGAFGAGCLVGKARSS